MQPDWNKFYSKKRLLLDEFDAAHKSDPAVEAARVALEAAMRPYRKAFGIKFRALIEETGMEIRDHLDRGFDEWADL